MPKLLVIVGSTRPGRAGKPVADWFADRAREHGGFDVDVADLAEIDLPLLDEPKHPRLGEYEHEHTRRWSDRVTAADAVVLVTPEYNHGYPAPLKNAIDTVSKEWGLKPVGFVSYGGVSGGTRAMSQLVPVVTVLQMIVVQPAVNIPFVGKQIDGGRFEPNDVTEGAAKALLDELLRVEAVTRALRSST